jgi:hypothetical protein
MMRAAQVRVIPGTLMSCCSVAVLISTGFSAGERVGSLNSVADAVATGAGVQGIISNASASAI